MHTLQNPTKSSQNNNQKVTLVDTVNELGCALQNLDNTVKEFKASSENRLDKLEGALSKAFTETKGMVQGSGLGKGLQLCRYKDARSSKEKSLLESYLRHGKSMEYKSYSQGESGGGNFLPMTLVSDLMSREKKSFRDLASVSTIDGNSLTVLTDHGKDSEVKWADDGAYQETRTSEVEKIEIPLHTLYAYTHISCDLIEDTKINIVDWFLSSIRRSFVDGENQAFIRDEKKGSRPESLLSYGLSREPRKGFIQSFSTGSDQGFSLDNPAKPLFDALYSLKDAYRQNGRWIMSSSTLAAIRQMQDQATKRYIWEPSFSSGEPSLLLGHPVEVFEEMPGVKSDDPHGRFILFGDFRSAYHIVTKKDMVVDRNPNHHVDRVTFFLKQRLGGKMVNFDAIKSIDLKVD